MLFLSNFKQLFSKIGLIKQGFGFIKVFFITKIDEVIPDWTILGLLTTCRRMTYIYAHANSCQKDG